MSDSFLYDLLANLVTLLVCGYSLFLLYRYLGRDRPGLSLGLPLALALGLRLASIVVLPLTGIERALRGGDEVAFIARATETAASDWGSGAWIDALTGSLHEFVFAVQIVLIAPPEGALRITQVTIAVIGLLLLAVAVYELAGPRAATIALVVLAVEPSNIFFSTFLHKEPNLILAAGLVVFAGTSLWKDQQLRWIPVMAAGCLIAVATREYAGWFLIAAAAVIMLHAGLRAGASSSLRSYSLIAGVLAFGAVTAPTVLQASTDENLERRLQGSQEANVEDPDANLSLEQVDFASRGGVITNLPQRTVDVLTKPYPWQLGNTSQQLGAAGALITLFILGWLFIEGWRSRGEIMSRAGPFVYVALGLLVAYSLSAGNAGTAFRYRTHVIELAVCLLVILYFARQQAGVREVPRRPSGKALETQPLET